MMLIPQPPNFGIADNLNSLVKANYFSSRDNNEIVAAASVTQESPNSAFRSCPQSQGITDRSMFAPRMQSDVTGFNMYSGPPGAPGAGTITSPAAYGAPTNPHHSFVPPHYGSSGIEHSPYYPSLGPTGYESKSAGSGEVWPSGYGQGAPPYYQYENFGTQYPYDSRYCGMDVNDGVRRKNATRESTNTLKAWLQEHKKNPYPTKGEKIMLAIITKMTLTQVSTWFANARRRLKKENKMTWVPKNRTNDSSNSSEDRRESDDKDSDEKLDEDCQSDTEGEEQILKSNKSDLNSDVSENNDGKSGCQYQQENPIGYTQDSDIINQSGQNDSPDSRYSSNPTRIVDSNLQSRLQDPEQPCPPFEQVRDPHQPHRSIWSPLESRDETQHNREHYRDFSEHPRSSYSTLHHHVQNDSSTPIHHPSQGFPLLQNSQQNPFPPTSSHDRFATANLSGSPGSSTSHIVDGDSMDRRNECRFTSPVTNLQNWVNGVFHAPTSISAAGDKALLHTSKPSAVDEATDLSTRINFSYQQPYNKHAPLTSSKSEQYGQVGSHTVSNSFPTEYYDHHRAVSKQHSANVVQGSSPFYQPGIDGTPPPSLQTKAHIDCNTLGHPVSQQRSPPNSCSISPQGQPPISDRIPFYDVPVMGSEQRSEPQPPPYVTHFHSEGFHDRNMIPGHNYLSRNGYLSPTNLPSNTTVTSSPSTLTGSNPTNKIEYKITQITE